MGVGEIYPLFFKELIMKIKVTDKSYDEVINIPHKKHKRPIRPNIFWRTLMRVVSSFDLKKTNFKYERVGMEKLAKNEPALVLMNHSSFIDLEILATLLYPRPFNIVTTTDAFVGKDWLLRQIGCIPTKKFIHDPSLLRDMMHCTKKLSSSVVLFPEASYTFDGTATPLPDTVGKFIKMLGAPVVMIRTYGAFARDPLYNNIQVRKVDVSAKETYLLSPDEIKDMTPEEINEVLRDQFSFDNFKWQQVNNVRISEPTRADYLNRVLYKCPVCKAEGVMVGKGTEIVCEKCGKVHILDEYGYLTSPDGNPSFTHIPDWYAWERECVKEELLRGEYLLDTEVDILMTVDTKKLYRVGEGRLIHDKDGVRITSNDGKINFEHKSLSSYSLYSDFNWYEIGDMISVGDLDKIFYCFPKNKKDVVAKARLAAEEQYKILINEKRG